MSLAHPIDPFTASVDTAMRGQGAHRRRRTGHLLWWLLVLGGLAAVFATLTTLGACGGQSPERALALGSPSASPAGSPSAARSAPVPSSTITAWATEACEGARRALSPGYTPDRDDLYRIGHAAVQSGVTPIMRAGGALVSASQRGEGLEMLQAVADLSTACQGTNLG